MAPEAVEALRATGKFLQVRPLQFEV